MCKQRGCKDCGECKAKVKDAMRRARVKGLTKGKGKGKPDKGATWDAAHDRHR